MLLVPSCRESIVNVSVMYSSQRGPGFESQSGPEFQDSL